MSACPCQSCRTRASWTAEERARFDAEDAWAEAFESTGVPRPRYLVSRLKGPTRSLVGRRFGSLVVKAWQRRDNHRRAVWLCQCDCGKTSLVRTDCLLRKRAVTSCRSCAQRARRLANPVALCALSAAAKAAGLDPHTVRQRVKRGWPEALLFAPLLSPHETAVRGAAAQRRQRVELREAA